MNFKLKLTDTKYFSAYQRIWDGFYFNINYFFSVFTTEYIFLWQLIETKFIVKQNVFEHL